MKLMDRSLLAALLKPFLFCLVAFYFLFIIVDLFGTLDEVIRNKANLLLVLKYYLVPAPFIFQLVVPAAFFLSVLYVLVEWSGSRELVALQVGGVSLGRISIPFFLLSLGVMGVQYGLFYGLSPKANEKRQTIEDQIDGRGGRAQIFQRVVYKNPTTGALWFIQEIDITARTLKQAEVLLSDELGRDRLKIFAARGTFKPEGYWDFGGVRRVDFGRDGVAKPPQDLAQLDVDFLNESPEQLVAVLRPAGGMSWPELSAFIHAPYQPAPSRMAPYWTEHQYRLAYPWLNPVLCLFAFALGITHDRQSKAASVFNCMLLLAFLLAWMQLSLALGNGKRLSPWVAAWNPIVLFGLAGLALFAEKTGWLWNLRHYIQQSRPQAVAVE
jgi:lipopolysaccharide export system permease protein